MTKGIINNEIRFLILRRDNFTCQYCGKKAYEAKLEVDHIIPRSSGGANDSENLITSCKECNRAKRDKKVEIKKPKKIYLPENEKVTYPVYQARLSNEVITWLRQGRIKYGTANKMFLELIKRYEGKI